MIGSRDYIYSIEQFCRLIIYSERYILIIYCVFFIYLCRSVINARYSFVKVVFYAIGHSMQNKHACTLLIQASGSFVQVGPSFRLLNLM